MSLSAGSFGRLLDKEVDERLAGEEAFPEGVALAFGDDEFEEVAGVVALVDLLEGGGVLRQGDDLVFVAVDYEDGDLGFGESGAAFDGVEFPLLSVEFVGGDAVGGGSAFELGVGGVVVNGVDTADAGRDGRGPRS